MAPSPPTRAEIHRLELQDLLESLGPLVPSESVTPDETLFPGGALRTYFQKPGKDGLLYPCVLYNRDRSQVVHADNIKFFLKKRWTVTVMDRNPDSDIPDLVEALPWSELDRTFIADGVNHWVFTLFY